MELKKFRKLPHPSFLIENAWLSKPLSSCGLKNPILDGKLNVGFFFLFTSWLQQSQKSPMKTTCLWKNREKSNTGSAEEICAHPCYIHIIGLSLPSPLNYKILGTVSLVLLITPRV